MAPKVKDMLAKFSKRPKLGKKQSHQVSGAESSSRSKPSFLEKIKLRRSSKQKAEMVVAADGEQKKAVAPTVKQKKKKKRSKAAFKPSKGEKYVLFIGDEGAILTYIEGSVVKSRQFVPDAGAQSLRELKQAFAKNEDAPLFLVIDNMDQSYMQQTLPPVSALSISKLVKRRLDRDFADSNIKGAVPLGREKKGRKDWNYLMVAVEESPQLTTWLEFIEQLPNYFKGIYLVAVESEYLVQHIEQSIKLPEAEDEAEWKFLVSHNKVGGFRQVILRNGKMVFTRLAQPIGESSTEMVAGNIEQEMLSTIEYMKRLSYTPQDGLDVYIIASEGIRDAIDINKFPSATVRVYTPYELAQYLGIEGATQPTDQFGDVILAAAIGCSRKHVLPLSTPTSKQVNQLHQFIFMQRAASGLLGLGIVGYMAAIGVGLFSLSQEQGDAEDALRSQRNRITALRDEINRSDVDIERADDLLFLYRQLDKENISPLPFIQSMYTLNNAPIWVNGLEWSLGEGGVNTAPNFLSGAEAEMMNAKLNLEFLNVTANPKAFAVVSERLLSDIRSWLPDYTVSYGEIPAAYVEGNELEITFDDEGVEAASADAVAPRIDLIISGKHMTQPMTPESAAAASDAQSEVP